MLEWHIVQGGVPNGNAAIVFCDPCSSEVQ
jgi:hypothetical protein